jgi:hypothetical protein
MRVVGSGTARALRQRVRFSDKEGRVMRRLWFTVALTAAVASGVLSSPALARPTGHLERPATPVADHVPQRMADRVSDVTEWPRLERGADSRRDEAPVRLACENGCAQPRYTRE